ncbi:MAG TPA: hypothetical protein VFA33_17855 [Bryobacteraceae bacterium]|nr:hypothetical protein [Bryobacteraceae bacterium]
MTNQVQVQHINVKIFATEPANIQLADAIPVFHRWIQESVCEEILIDVADYGHVPAGPGVVLVGHEANYSLDQAFFRLGLLYNRKSARDGGPQDNLLQAFYSALVACRRLEEEPEFRGKLKFDAGRCEVILNDRLLAPNTEATWEALRPEFEKFFDGLYGAGAYQFCRLGEPRERFRVGVEASRPVDVRSLLEEVQPA